MQRTSSWLVACRLLDIAESSDNLDIAALSKPVEKWYLAWPRWMRP